MNSCFKLLQHTNTTFPLLSNYPTHLQMSGRGKTKTVLPKIEVPPEAPAAPAAPAVVEEPKKEKAQRKPRTLKPVEEAPAPSPAPPPVVEEIQPEPPAAEKPKATRKPRATKTTEEVPTPSPVVEEPKAEEHKQFHIIQNNGLGYITNVIVAKPKRGRPKKVEGEIPTHQMEAPAKANPKIKVKREPKLDADGNVVKRAPTEYNIFLAKTMAELKNEYKDYEVKPNQKELMAEVAAKWRELKAAA